MGRLLGRVVVGLTLLLICFISYSSQIFIIWPWYGSALSVELLYLLLPFKCVLITSTELCYDLISYSVLVAMLLWNYWLSVLTDPGRVPDSWVYHKILHPSATLIIIYPLNSSQM